MKTLTASLLTLAIAAAPASAEAAPSRPTGDRVTAAAATGQLTRSEIERLRRDQRDLSRYVQFALNDGRLTQRERKTLDKMDQRMDRHFNRYITNPKTR